MYKKKTILNIDQQTIGKYELRTWRNILRS